ncbi:hypothetical protein OO9_01867 [Providencia alcalifaciens Dmel2]|nr:hypothetical protein OO9_01867 [Providencia alcalifaciens Dmel2]
MYTNPITLLLIFIPILACILFIIAQDKQQPDIMTLFLKFSIYLLSALTFVNLIFFARAFTDWY